ncbi:Neurofibromin [Geodia barretti]|uniref:Neurofibromin n=1 Tax=Geodia barretti TaxID=519541 RepID=A0AA35S3F0_GEOBA|nr:Neurofibromin [Geodia barretti]
MNTAPFVMTVSRELAQKEPHLTLEFLSEVVAGFQQYTPALKQFCLAYMSPWLPNLSLSLFEATATDHEKLMRLVDMLVALSISEDAIYPLIQSFVWDKIGGEPRLLKRVLDSFIRMSISDGLGSRKLEVLADTAVTLEQSTDGAVTTEVIKKILKTIAHTSDKVTQSLEQHFLWSELTVLSRFLLALSCNNPRNAVKNLTDVFYLCIIMMGNGPSFVKATIHGIVLNTVQSLASVPEIMANEEATKSVSLKLAEISEPKFYHQFGIQKRASSLAYQRSVQPGRGPALELGHHGSPSSTCVTAITQHLLDLVNATAHLIPECTWMQRWQKLARRTSFHYNPALQTRSFLMLGVISNKASLSLVTRTLRVLEETLGRREDEVYLLESITICLTAFLPLLEEGSKLIYHFFWVAVGIMQLGEATLYAASLELMEACIKKLTLMKVFEKQTLTSAMQPSREELEWPLSQMDREVGISFSSDFNFSLAALLYKGFSHPLSTVRTRTQELLTTLFFIHSPDVSGGRIEVYQDNLAYITVLFPESEIVRKHLREPRPRLKTLASSLEDSPTHSSYNTLLSSHAVPSQKQQILFLFVLACALINTQDEKKTQILYEFLANASKVYFNVFPLIRSVLMQNLVLTLQQSQSPHVLSAVQQLVSVAVERVPSDTDCKLTVINDLGFGGVREFFNPFPKVRECCITWISQQTCNLYVHALIPVHI